VLLSQLRPSCQHLPGLKLVQLGHQTWQGRCGQHKEQLLVHKCWPGLAGRFPLLHSFTLLRSLHMYFLNFRSVLLCHPKKVDQLYQTGDRQPLCLANGIFGLYLIRKVAPLPAFHSERPVSILS